jgi:two-component system cell cycle response regulator
MARILMIEDNPENLALMRYLLRAFGHDTVEAQDGEEGLVLAAGESALDLILCDVHLPRLDGYEVARRLKAEPGLAEIPRVAVTALAMVGDKDKVLAAGFDGYIAKPIAPREFVGQVEGFLPAALAGGKVAPPRPTPVPAESRPQPEPKQEQELTQERAPGGARILVVDNVPANRNLAVATLAPFGYRLTLASRVSEALELLAQHPFDLILSDLHMPDEDGIGLLVRVKADPRLCRIPFVLISASVWGFADQRRGLALGAASFLLRPIAPRRLLAEIESCLGPPSP